MPTTRMDPSHDKFEDRERELSERMERFEGALMEYRSFVEQLPEDAPYRTTYISNYRNKFGKLKGLLELYEAIDEAGNVPGRRLFDTYEKESRELVFTEEDLTSDYLQNTLVPFLAAVTDMQEVFDDIQGRPENVVKVKLIRQRSPININLTGATEAIQQIKESIVPWRRKHAEKMAHLAEQEKRVQIGAQNAEILERKAHAERNRAEAEKILAEAAKHREEATRMKLENGKLSLELDRAKVELALDILAKLAPNLSENERITYLARLLPPLQILVSTELEVIVEKWNTASNK